MHRTRFSLLTANKGCGVWESGRLLFKSELPWIKPGRREFNTLPLCHGLASRRIQRKGKVTMNFGGKRENGGGGEA